jgi:hypothetical protein
MRVTLSTFESRPYVSFRVWERGENNQLYPAKGKGCSVRIAEVVDVIAALRQVEDLVASEDRGERVSHHPARSQPRDEPPVRGYDGSRAPGVGYSAKVGPRQDEQPRFVDKRRRPAPREFCAEELPTPGDGASRAFDEM